MDQTTAASVADSRTTVSTLSWEPFGPPRVTAINWRTGQLSLNLKDVQRGMIYGFNMRPEHSWKEVRIAPTTTTESLELRNYFTALIGKAVNRDFVFDNTKETLEYIGGEDNPLGPSFKKKFHIRELPDPDSMARKIFLRYFAPLIKKDINWETGQLLISRQTQVKAAKSDIALKEKYDFTSISNPCFNEYSDTDLNNRITMFWDSILRKNFKPPNRAGEIIFIGDANSTLPKSLQRKFSVREIMTTDTMDSKIFREWLKRIRIRHETGSLYDKCRKIYGFPLKNPTVKRRLNFSPTDTKFPIDAGGGSVDLTGCVKPIDLNSTSLGILRKDHADAIGSTKYPTAFNTFTRTFQNYR